MLKQDSSYPRSIHLWLTRAIGRECRFPNGVGRSSGTTSGSETGLGRHLLRPAEGNEAGWANRHHVGDSLRSIGMRMVHIR